MDTRVDPYREGAQVVSGDVSVGKTLPQCSPALHLLVRRQHSQIDRSRRIRSEGDRKSSIPTCLSPSFSLHSCSL